MGAWGGAVVYMGISRHQEFTLYVMYPTFITHIFLVDLSIVINWTSQFPNLGVPGVLFNFHWVFDGNSC